MELWPAIDLLHGSAVRLRQGRFDQVTIYDADPSAIAARWRGRTRRLHVVDLEGSRAGKSVQTETIRQIIKNFGPGIQVGGGLRTADDIDRVLAAGAARAVLGTAAVRSPELVRAVANAYPHRIVLAVDARNGYVATEGWETTSDQSVLALVESLSDCPLAAVLYTDIERDGTQVGPNLEATATLAQATRIPVLASGGVGHLNHLRALASLPGVAGAIVGRALYEGTFSLEDAREASQDFLRFYLHDSLNKNG